MIEDDEISLIDLFAVLLRYKFLIIAITGIAMIGVLVFSVVSIMQPPENLFYPMNIRLRQPSLSAIIQEQMYPLSLAPAVWDHWQAWQGFQCPQHNPTVHWQDILFPAITFWIK